MTDKPYSRIQFLGGQSLDTCFLCWGGGVSYLHLPTCWMGHRNHWTLHPRPGRVYGMGGRNLGELYGASYYGRVFKRLKTGWQEIGEQLWNIHDLVQWDGKLLVATNHGLYRVEKDSLVIEQPYLEIQRICPGKTLMWSDMKGVHEQSGLSNRLIPLVELLNTV